MAVDVNIRRVGADETGMLRDISISTFTHTYSAHNTPENMRNYIEESFGLERFAAELKSALTQYYFAERGSEILGYLKLNFGEAQTNHSLAKACEIERIYVVSK